MDVSFLVIISVFLIYYILVLFSERKVIQDPKEILDKFLSTVLLYGGVSIIYFSVTGKPFLGDSLQTYNVYIFLIGFIAVLWTVPNLLSEFGFFRRFTSGKKRGKKA